MSSFSSWLSKVSASNNGLLSDSRRELPRWRSPSPMAESMIPPPIVRSTYLLTPQFAPKPVTLDKASPLEDRQSELEADLQFLLDAQAEGLVKGLEGGTSEDQASTGSTTPTAQSVRSSSARRRKPIRKKPGLRTARRGIYNSILALSAVKQDELRAVDVEVQKNDDSLAQIEEWEHKRTGLREATQQAHDNEDTVRSQRLRQQANVLQEEINNVELQLSDMRSRQKKLLRQVAVAENSLQAKLASYTSSLSMLEADVQQFLGNSSLAGKSKGSSSDGTTSTWQSSPKRRTLDMAREHYTGDRDTVLEQRQRIEHERSALDAGAAVWKDVVVQVTDFEKRLRSEMTCLNSHQSQSSWEDEQPSSHSTWEESPPQQEHDSSVRLRDLLDHLDKVLERLEAHFQEAEARDWKLLIAAIGAETDALRQGKQILENVLGTGLGDRHAGSADDLVDMDSSTQNTFRQEREGADEIEALDKSFETARPVTRRFDSDSETDDPDPDLLFSQQDVSEE